MNKHTFHQMTLGFEVETAHMKDQWYWSLCAALLIVCLQLAVVLYKAGPGTLSERYLNLAQWDTHWYENIIDKGYHANFPVDIWNSNSVNIKFFPGYPISAKFVQWLTGLSTTVSLAIAAQLAAIGFWTYFLLLLRRYKISWPLILSGVTLILSFPSAYFLVMPYTEPLFMMSLFGYIYWLDDKRKHSWWIAGIHGCILSSTKIIGAAVAILPLIYYLCSRKTRYMQKRKMIAISLMNPTGIVAYLTYVHLKFGNWQLPFMAEHAWGAYPNYFGIFHLQFYKIFKPSVVAGVMNPDHVSMIAYPIALISIAILLGLDIIYSMRKKATMLSQRIILSKPI